ncbi:hypothetical protein PCASD_05974 [Puccinia coronata f. sp. avenae]|uniref:Copia protein n=1 Tax=Puccinia coronata f. sp. avenae TaxID=200324 RepID=A0A2N5V9T8_9BASI|nr:hypothetical protein PCASD_05974 [Puccinia coronata f. sp. avenae]
MITGTIATRPPRTPIASVMVPFLGDTPIPLHVNNKGAKALAKNPEHHARTKHIHARYHFIRECVQDDEISLLHVSTH